MTDNRPETPADRFHAHLDVCARCAKTPFDLCPLGNILLLLCPVYPPEPRKK
jgi:hypothetical protein